MKLIFFSYFSAWCQTAAGIQKVTTLPPSARWIFSQFILIFPRLSSLPWTWHVDSYWANEDFCSTPPMLKAVSNNFAASSPSPTSSSSLMCLSLMCPPRVFQTRNAPWIIHHENQHGNLQPAQSDGLDESRLLWQKKKKSFSTNKSFFFSLSSM